MHQERLKLAIEIVEAAPESEFDMGHWDCGTTACAGGWIARDPRTEVKSVDDGRTVEFEGYCGYRALAVWLGCSYSVALSLFSLAPYQEGHYGIEGKRAFLRKARSYLLG